MLKKQEKVAHVMVVRVVIFFGRCTRGKKQFLHDTSHGSVARRVLHLNLPIPIPCESFFLEHLF